MLNTLNRQHGMTLIEILVAMFVGIIVMGGAIKVHVNAIKTQSDNIKRVRLNMDMRTMMDIMVKDIRRAGFATDDPQINLDCLLDNHFKEITVVTTGGNTAGSSCFLYSYNRNNNACDAVDNNEHFGFALSGTSLMMKDEGDTNGSSSCITDGNNIWQNLNYPDLEVTTLSFNLSETELNVTAMQEDINSGDGVCSAGEACTTCQNTQDCLSVRKVTITLSGQLTDDLSLTISEQVRIRNDKYISAP